MCPLYRDRLRNAILIFLKIWIFVKKWVWESYLSFFHRPGPKITPHRTIETTLFQNFHSQYHFFSIVLKTKHYFFFTLSFVITNTIFITARITYPYFFYSQIKKKIFLIQKLIRTLWLILLDWSKKGELTKFCFNAHVYNGTAPSKQLCYYNFQVNIITKIF